MKAYDQLLLRNEAWANEKKAHEPDFFKKLAAGQAPSILWIGCSDSRVPESVISDSEPGEIFVHRNIANLVVDNDASLLSVLQYSVDVLKVKHIVLCGHYGCGGVKASMDNNNLGTISHWIRNIQHVHKAHEDELNGLDAADKFKRLVELNVIAQCNHLMQTATVQNAWSERQLPEIHGCVFSLETGKINELVSMRHGSFKQDPIYTYK